MSCIDPLHPLVPSVSPEKLGQTDYKHPRRVVFHTLAYCLASRDVIFRDFLFPIFLSFSSSSQLSLVKFSSPYLSHTPHTDLRSARSAPTGPPSPPF